MLRTKKEMKIDGYAEINNTVVISLTAVIPYESGVGTISQYIQNPDLYDANKSQIRKDVAEFTNMVYDIEDEIALEAQV